MLRTVTERKKSDLATDPDVTKCLEEIHTLLNQNPFNEKDRDRKLTYIFRNIY